MLGDCLSGERFNYCVITKRNTSSNTVFLNHPERKTKIQEQGRITVREHTYKARAKQIIDTLIENNILIEGEK